MSVLPFIPKDDQKLPDWYSMTVKFIDGTSDTFKVAAHKLGDKVFEFVTFEDEWHWVPLQCVKILSFDKSFSKIVAIKQNNDGAK